MTTGIGKLAKDFYETKFGPGTMSAAKVKELLTDEKGSNFDTLLYLSLKEAPIAYSICFQCDLALFLSVL